MHRVLRAGGYVGMHDLAWRESAPPKVRRWLAEFENESPETQQGWERCFEAAGFREIMVLDKSELLQPWMKKMRDELGALRCLGLAWHVIRRWGLSGLIRVLRSERLFRSRHLGYVLVVARR